VDNILESEINGAVDKMILSASGWRSVFADDGDEESSSDKISKAHCIIAGAAAYVFAEYLESKAGSGKPLILLAGDTRPSGSAIIAAMTPVLLSYGCEVRCAGFAAAPQIMAWARSIGSAENQAAGFIYISASHNPIGHNGIKFGLTDGGVLPAQEAEKLIEKFKVFLKENNNLQKIEEQIFNANNTNNAKDINEKINIAERIYKAQPKSNVGSFSLDDSRGSLLKYSDQSFKAYYNFCGEVAWGGSDLLAAAVKDSLAEKPVGIVCDFNGSARAASIDKDFFTALGFKFKSINDVPGKIAHRIVPEGDSLEPCAKLLEEAHREDDAFILGYVPDCDGDRGNLVIWDDAANKARPLESCDSIVRAKARPLGSQEVFALAVAAELSHLVWTGELKYGDDGKVITKAAIAVNDPTSMRTDRIAEAFGVSVFRAEVGEANVVSLARKLREDGYLVRILGEGSAGGNITHPCAVRDPVNTVLALAKMLCVRSTDKQSGLFEIWCKRSNQTDKYRKDFTLSDIIDSLPQFTTTQAYHKDAVMRIKTKDHSILKARYQDIFAREWKEKSDELKTRYGIYKWQAIACNGTAERRNIKNFKEAGKGGLKILFSNDKEKEIAYIWMRGSATEPVFRIMADAQGCGNTIEKWLLDWQRQMVMEADSNA